MKKTILLQKATRIEGNADIQIEIEDGRITTARFRVQDFRGLERFLCGRRVEFIPQMVSRICGLCSASHQIASLRAIEAAVGARVPSSVEALREILLFGEWIGSHALSYFFLTMPDLMESGEGLLQMAQSHPGIAADAMALRRAGLRIVEIIGGRAVHPVTLGIARFIVPTQPGQLDEVRQLAEECLRLAAKLLDQIDLLQLRPHPIPFPRDQQLNFLTVEGLGPTARLRACGRDARVIEDFPAEELEDHISEMRADWSFAKFPYLKRFGFPGGITLVGPLARLFRGDSLLDDPSIAALPLARGLLDRTALGLEQYDTCRFLEIIWAAKRIRSLLEEVDLANIEGEVNPALSGKGIGVVEAPRGLLVHSYLINRGCLERMRLLVATQFNNPFMNLMIRELAGSSVNGDKLTPEGERSIGRCIRLFDPCLSCATH